MKLTCMILASAMLPFLNRCTRQLLLCTQAVKLVANETSVKKKTIYSIALRKFGKQTGSKDDLLDSCKPE